MAGATDTSKIWLAWLVFDEAVVDEGAIQTAGRNHRDFAFKFNEGF